MQSIVSGAQACANRNAYAGIFAKLAVLSWHEPSEGQRSLYDVSILRLASALVDVRLNGSLLSISMFWT